MLSTYGDGFLSVFRRTIKEIVLFCASLRMRSTLPRCCLREPMKRDCGGAILRYEFCVPALYAVQDFCKGQEWH